MLLEYSKPEKLANFLLCEIEKRRCVARPRSRPYRAIIDVSNACILRCPYCPTGARQHGRPPGFLGVEKIVQLMDRVGGYLYIAFLYNWGEPLLHPNLPEIVARVHDRKVMTVVSTNLNMKSLDRSKAAFDSGLDHFIVSVDGATQEIYSRYRVKGELELVLENLQALVAYKRERKRRHPVIEWSYLVFDHNRHQVEEARELAAAIGVDVFQTSPGYVPDRPAEFWENETRCGFLWDTIAMQADGGIGACCHLIDKDDDFVDSPSPPFGDIWHAPRFATARRLFSYREAARLPAELEHPCLNCPLVRKLPSFSRFVATHDRPGPEAREGIFSGRTNSVRSSKGGV